MTMKREITIKAFVVGATLVLSACMETSSFDSKEEQAIVSVLADAAGSAQASYDYQTASVYYKRLYIRQPDNIDALLGYARNLRYVGSVRDAVKLIKNGIKKFGDDPVLYLELAKSQLAASLIADAEISILVARDGRPDDWDVYSTYGIILDRMGRFNDAHGQYREALKLSPRNVAVSNNYALSLAQDGRLEDGIWILEQVVNSENSDMHSRQNLALLYGLNGDFVNAEKLLVEDLPAETAAKNLATLKNLQKK